MRGAEALRPAKNKFVQVYPLKSSWGILTTTTPKKEEKSGFRVGETVKKENTDPIVTFSRPPPLPPILGPLLVLSVLDTWSGRDSDDNDR